MVWMMLFVMIVCMLWGTEEVDGSSSSSSSSSSSGNNNIVSSRRSSNMDGFGLVSKSLLPLFVNREEEGGGGGGGVVEEQHQKKKKKNSNNNNNNNNIVSVDWNGEDIEKMLKQVSKAQETLKRVDGASHELYQRTHSSTLGNNNNNNNNNDYDENYDEKEEESGGRSIRSASRIGCAADGLLAAELCDLLQQQPEAISSSSSSYDEDEEGTLSVNGGRHIVYNGTIDTSLTTNHDNQEVLRVHVMILWEPHYNGGAGLNHGGVDALLLKHSQQHEHATTTTTTSTTQDINSSRSSRGRYLVILMDHHREDLAFTLKCLDQSHLQYLELQVGLVAQEYASVSNTLYQAAIQILTNIHPHLLHPPPQQHTNPNNNNNNNNITTLTPPHPPPAIHFVASSIAGGVATLAAAILDGTLPFPSTTKTTITTKHTNKKRKRSKQSSKKTNTNTNTDQQHMNNENEHEEQTQTVQGFGKGRTSAVVLGPPPCLSANVKASYVTTLVHGDDIVCRTTPQSMDRLYQRVRKAIQHKHNPFTKSFGWMTDTLSLTLSNIKTYAHGSEGEESKLKLPGNVYVLKPRRYHHTCSLHQIGSDITAKHQAWRAAILWQLDDILLSKSMWNHHLLSNYIQALDRVQLRSYQNQQ